MSTYLARGGKAYAYKIGPGITRERWNAEWLS